MLTVLKSRIVSCMAEPRRSEIERIRKRKGMKRRALADAIECSYKHIWGIERGKHPAAEETLQRIAIELGVELEQVMVRDERGVA